MSETTYKFLNGDRAPHTDYAWPLPKGKRPGKWVHADGEPVICRNGIHAVTLEDGSAVMDWLRSDCYIIDLGGTIIEGEGKVAASKGRLLRKVKGWTPENRVRFAADCAERVLKHAGDAKPQARAAIKAARAWADCPCEEHRNNASASGASAFAASASAAAFATYASAFAAYAAAAYATYAATYTDEHRWQLKRLAHYLTEGER